METLQIGRLSRQVPATWNELRREQLLRLLPLVQAPARPGRRLHLLALLSGYPLPLLASLPVVTLAQLLPLTNWLGSDQHRLTAQLLPTLRVAGPDRWPGPRESFRNLLFGEFIFADTFFVLYHQRGEAGYLDQLLATLYRPARAGAGPADADWNGDPRVAFNEHHLDSRAPRFARVPAAERQAVLAWYRGCRAELALEFPDVFVAAESEASAAQAPPDWSRVLRKLAGGAFGPVGATAGQPLRLVLAELQDLAHAYHQSKK